MRIVGGDLKGRAITSPKGSATRPTSDRTREAVFNILHHAKWRRGDIIGGARVIDVFAGTGALGIEALSRGAAHAVFVEREPAAARVCEENIQTLGVRERAMLMRFDGLKPVPRPLYLEPRTLIFLDPPYGKDMAAKALTGLAERDWLKPGAICIVEMARRQPENVPAGFIQHDERNYGIAAVKFLEWPGSL
ncbi:MAG: 16S rRNA (guanine(966)-N(2))-methyltransferase RsmD [Alphaproteobacteria bacterium]